MKFKVVLERKNSKRVSDKTIKSQIEYLVRRGTSGIKRDRWQCHSVNLSPPEPHNGDWLRSFTLIFERKPSRNSPSDSALTAEMNSILERLAEVGAGSKFATYPWQIRESKPIGWTPTSDEVLVGPVQVKAQTQGDERPAGAGEHEDKEFVISDIVNFDKAMTLDQIVIPEVLLNGTDSEIENHPHFQGIYGRAAHIRVMFSSIKTMIDTEGLRRNHVVMYGKPGCGKSSLIKGAQAVLGQGAYLAINANSATKAGIEAIFLDRLRETGTPPIIFIEEIEKTLEAILTVWLSILDERAEVLKVTHHKARRAKAQILGIATANDKPLFDRLMGGRPSNPGALSSRFTKPLYVPRPDRDTMRRILLRDIQLYGGDSRWADPCLEIADELGTNDPRMVLSLLDGGDRLLSGGYREDILYIHSLEKNEDQEDINRESLSVNE